MKLKTLVSGLALMGLATHALAQAPEQRVTITGSSIKRIQAEGALPVTTITRAELTREGISTTEQLVMSLTTNGTGLDNLASNADVVDGAQRGNNGASSANLRGQGSNATLILLNGRRVASHGLNGGQVDLNQIPFSALEKVEILKDGASAIYGTDAVGGVINFITRKNYTGLTADAFVDVTEQGGGNIYRGALTGGFGDLDRQGFNVLATLAYSDNKALRGDERDFTRTNQPNRGLSPDTRGAPHATIVPLAGATVGGVVLPPTIFPNAASVPFIPGTTPPVRASGGINVLDLPGGPGCGSIEGMFPYSDTLWAAPDRQYACSWDTGRAAVIQQPVQNLNLLTRGTFKLGGDHLLSAEFMASEVKTAKRFSNIQLLPGNTTNPLRYPSTGAAYADIIARIEAAFPGFTAPAGAPIAYRWRCIECGPREIETKAEAQRLFVGVEGPLLGWDYRAGASQATSTVKSTLGTGYHYRRSNAALGVNGIVEALNSGAVNPFLLPGQTQSAAGLAAIAATSAAGVVLYGGKFTTTQIDATVSGPLFKLPGGESQLAVGLDFREEKYRFNGDERAATARPEILGAPFDDGNALAGVKRDVKAAFAEWLVPFAKWGEVTLAVRRDDYDGFGSTTNPKVSFKIQPVAQFFIRGSYNEAFRVPTFNQIYNAPIQQQYLGSDVANPATCPPPSRPIAGNPNCQLVPNLFTINGGNKTLGPETAKQWLIGFVAEPIPDLSISVDLWNIERENQIRVPSIQLLLENYSLFPERFFTNTATGENFIDQRWLNTGGSRTKGVEVGIRGSGKLFAGNWNAAMDISYLLDKRSRVTQNAPWGASEVGINTLAGDLGVRWKHNLTLGYKQGDWAGSVTQMFRNGYRDRVAPGVAAALAAGAPTPPDWKPTVDDYTVYNASLTYTGIKNLTLTAGIKNLLNEDPPFSYTYDDVTGGGGAWEPRLADPRGRSFTLSVNYRFF
ncbi:MAG: TonB-dependent receptor domain-containing protein [Pseudomonadota bacterium]|jgi:iron complex outermembrane receptor protein